VTCSVLVVDDHQAFAEALAALLADDPELHVVGIATSPVDARRAIDRDNPDMLVVDAALGDADGLELVADAVAQSGDRRVVVLGDSADPELATAAVHAGALAFVVKGAGIEDLLRAMRGALRGQFSIPPELVSAVISALLEVERTQNDTAALLVELTPREREVLDLMLDGKDRAQIARELFTSVNTVRSHMQKIFRKLGVHSGVEAISVALRAQPTWPRRAQTPPKAPSR
jgi:DNA-binding NarL/FixJ family response regulator